MLKKRWRRLTGTEFYQNQQLMIGINCSKTVENALKAKSALVDCFLCIMNFFRPVKLSTRNIIWALYFIFVKLFVKRGRIYGKTTLVFYTTIMRYLILHWFFVTFSPKMLPTSSRNLLIHLIWLHVTFGYFQNSKGRGNRFESIENIQCESEGYAGKWFFGMFWGLKKWWHKCIISGGDHFEEDEF